MKQVFTYWEDEAFKVNEVYLVGDFNEWDKTACRLEKIAPQKWQVEVEVSNGKHLYQFWIDHELLLNDPKANYYLPDEEGTLKSVIVINEEGKRLYNNKQYSLKISGYCLSGEVGDVRGVSKRNYVLGEDENIVLGMGFEEVTGIHQLTVAWYSPDGKLYYEAGHHFFQPKDQPEAKLWFKLNLKEGLPEGDWSVVIFIDGKFMHDDKLTIIGKQEVDEDKLLPIGSIVKLQDEAHLIMVFGTEQKNKETGEAWDYIGCIYPEGHLGSKYTVLFNKTQIEKTVFVSPEIKG